MTVDQASGTDDVRDLTPTSDQQRAIDMFRTFVHDPARWIFNLQGYAGTGKTTVARLAVDDALGRNSHVLVAAPTAKAATVVARRGFPQATTIHSLIYAPRTVVERDTRTGERRETVTFDLDHAAVRTMVEAADLLIVDEASMVSAQMARDLVSFDVKILIIGDPFQLPPVGDDGGDHPFRDAPVDALLAEVTRQARESPVLAIATRIRAGLDVPFGWYGDSLVWHQGADLEAVELSPDARVIVGKNETRRTLNERHRTMLGRVSWAPEPGDRVICRQNDYRKGLVNGEEWDVVRVDPYLGVDTVPLALAAPDPTTARRRRSTLDVQAWVHGFQGAAGERRLDKMTHRSRKRYARLLYAYALTAHNAQGSEFDEVVVFDESRVFRQDAARWLYTAVTRARERVVVLR